jgi:ADP-ribosylglycohydrolase
MIGALFGDIVGSIYEIKPIKSTNFPLFEERSTFTDDSVLSIAIADIILHEKPIVSTLKDYTRRYPMVGYGGNFYAWAMSDSQDPYNSWGNGAAMRISPVGFASTSLDMCLQKAKDLTEVTHNHPEGIKGGQATACVILLIRQGKSKSFIQNYIQNKFDYNLETPLEEIRPSYHFDVSCQVTVPVAIRSYLESSNFEEAIRLAISMGGDSDTLACITGGMAQAQYGISNTIKDFVMQKFPEDLSEIISLFQSKYLEK